MADAGTVEMLKEKRRKYVRRLGKPVLRAIDGYVGRHSLVPNAPVLDSALFPWVSTLEEKWRDIRDEVDRVLCYRDSIPRFQDASRDQYKISPDDKWRTFVLYGFGFKSELNCRLCPKTTAILEAVPALRTAFFSLLGPGKHVPRHKGVTKGMLRCHLGLIVPQRREDCWMEVGGVRCVWEEGRVFVFDDFYPHEVWNNTDEERVVLLIDVERPMTFGAKSLNRAILWGPPTSWRLVAAWRRGRSACAPDCRRKRARRFIAHDSG